MTDIKPLTSAELSDLKAKAKAATPGKWVVYNETDVWTEDNRYITTTDIGDVTEFEKNNTEHIAAANPETILRLIDTVERRDAWRFDMKNAPRDEFLFIFCPEDNSRWLASWQHDRWHGVDEHGLTRTAGYHVGSARVTGWLITAWQPLPAPPSEALAATEPPNE